MTKEPILMLSRRKRPMERVAQAAGQWARRGRVQSERLRKLLREAQSAEGRRRQVVPLMGICVALGALVGFAIGWHGQRRG